MPKRKADVEQAEGVCESKALRGTLPMLLDEVLARVFAFLGRVGIADARQVCRQ